MGGGAIERWSEEAADFFWQLAQAKAREAPTLLAHAAALARVWRWSDHDTRCHTGGETPSLADVLSHDPR